MTIQNIDDVMDRIMSLNRNLTEDSLKVLLSASGWDREDIMEGTRIFRNKNKNTVVATPTISTHVTGKDINKTENLDINKEPKSEEKINLNIANEKVQSDLELERMTDPKGPIDSKIDNNKNPAYTFNLNSRKDEPVKIEEENIVSPNLIKDNILNENPEHADKTEINIQTEKSDNQKSVITPVPTDPTYDTHEEKNSNLAKIIFFILLLLLLTVFAAYLLFPNFKNYINQKFLGGSTNQITITENNNQNLNPNLNNTENNNQIIEPTNPPIIYPNPNGSFTNPDNSTSSISNPNPDTNGNKDKEIIVNTGASMGDLDIEDLRKEIENLKNEVSKYKNSNSKGATVIKYISQKGPAGRGIVSVDAIATGFLINYTDGSKDTVPYSTTTIVDILSAQNICFRDTASTSVTLFQSAEVTIFEPQKDPDICLDRNSILNLLSR